MRGFANLGGNGFDRRPLERRRQVLTEGITPEAAVDDSMFRDETGEINKELLAAESYAFSGLIIEKMWDDLKGRETTYSNNDSVRIPLTETFWKDFADTYITLAQTTKETLLEEAKIIFAKPKEEWTSDETLVARYFMVQFVNKDITNLGAPSFIDLISIYTRLAKVAEEKFFETNKREPSRDELVHVLSDSSFQKMMEQLMMNNRQTGVSLFAALEGTATPDTDDTSRSFKTNIFEIYQSDTGPCLRPKEQFMNRYRHVMKEHLARLKESNKDIQPVLRCPVIYTGKLKEMCDWLLHEFTFQYVDQKYPKKL
ncbi:MAG: hypothetical protein V4668_00190 [Patescibacteria group bacterium]